MSEYIKREAAIESVREVYEREFPTADGAFDLFATRILPKTLKNLPAADVASVRRGKWVYGKDLGYAFGSLPKNKFHLYCTECQCEAFNRSEDDDPDFDVESDFCPNCGADMRGAE